MLSYAELAFSLSLDDGGAPMPASFCPKAYADLRVLCVLESLGFGTWAQLHCQDRSLFCLVRGTSGACTMGFRREVPHLRGMSYSDMLAQGDSPWRHAQTIERPRWGCLKPEASTICMDPKST